FPPMCVNGPYIASGQILNHTGLTMILPYIDQAPLYNQFNFSAPSNDANSGTPPAASAAMANNIALGSTTLPVFMCPSDPDLTKVTQTQQVYNWYEELRHNAAPTSYLLSTAWMYADHQQYDLQDPAPGASAPLRNLLPNGKSVICKGL